MLVAFSTMDNNKLKIVAGSMRDAFGVQNQRALFRHHRIRRPADPAEAEERRPDRAGGCLRQCRRRMTRTAARTTVPRLQIDREFALASASLRQALQDMPELTEMSKHIMFEETSQGLNLEIVDQDGRSMFADGSKVPYERTRRLIQKLAAPLKATPLARFDHRPHRGGLRAGAKRLWRVRSFGRPRQCGAPNSRARRAAARAHFRGLGQGRQPAAVSRRSVAGGQPPRDHHPDARRSAASART